MENDDVEVTEIVELQATKVSGVGSPANGTPFLLLKAAADDTDDEESKDAKFKANQEKMKEGKIGKSDDEEEVVKELTAAERKEMPAKNFAYVDSNGGKHLPIHNKGHVTAALGRFKSTDFTGADKPLAAKQKAAAKIKAAAEEHGIEIDPDSPIAEAAKKSEVQDALSGTQKPEESGHYETAQSTAPGEETKVVTGNEPVPEPAHSVGGATTADIDINITKGVAVASLSAAIDALGAQRAAVKDGSAAEDALTATVPVIPLSELASTLASCVRTLEEHLLHERVEAAVEPGEIGDVWDMEDAKSALECALRLVANIAVMESLENEGATKNLDVEQLSAVRTTIDDAIGAVEAIKAGSASANEEEIIHMDVTKDELAESIAAGTVAAVEAAFKAKADKDAAKEKLAAEEAEKNANNDGDISESEIKPTKEVDADNINAVKSDGEDTDAELDPATKQVADQLEVVTKGLESLQETVAKFAKLPRSGGPSLDGKARGAIPAAEGRQSDQVTKSENDLEIETLEKSLSTETDPLMKDELGRKLTYARLMKMHETGQL